jgi:hypothetical protein
MAAERFESFTGRIRSDLIIPGGHPDFPAPFHPDLSRAEYVAGRVKGNAGFSKVYGFTIGRGLDGCVISKTGSEKLASRSRGEIGA